ncbi:MAG: ribonuclease H-like domain-containing protein [Nanobdellota archaeon]
MLKSTFIHMPGVGRLKEKFLWENNILTWDDFLQKSGRLNISGKEKIAQECVNSMEHYNKKNFSYFSEKIPINEHWRAYNDFSGSCCFLDIETTGLDKVNNKITTIGVYDGQVSKVFIRGHDLDQFEDYINKYSTLVTFNGRCFDIPFIKNTFSGIVLNHFHIDLRFFLKELGFKGGLKAIERKLGLSRDSEISEVDGFEAVRLWKRYQKGDLDALNRLISYNIADVENLKPLMDFGFNKIKDLRLTI